MSNPGVITLSEKEISASKSFRVEDNLGESIHFHYNDIRIDLTIPELLYISDICDDTIYELVGADKFDLDDFDGDFLNDNSQYLMDLERVVEDKVNISDVYYITKGFLNLPVRRRMNDKNAKKIAAVKMEYEKNAYHNKRITTYKPVLFNDNNTLMYGSYEAAKQYLENPGQEIAVLRMYYENGLHTVSNRPWVPFLFKWDKKRFIKVAKKAAMRLLK